MSSTDDEEQFCSAAAAAVAAAAAAVAAAGRSASAGRRARTRLPLKWQHCRRRPPLFERHGAHIYSYSLSIFVRTDVNKTTVNRTRTCTIECSMTCTGAN